MPGALIAPVAWVLGSIGASTAFIVGASGIIASAIFYGGLAAIAYLGNALLTPQQKRPEVPKPEDGKYNLKQSVPPLTYALGRVKKGGDYVFLEEISGSAYHITVIAAHRIKSFVSHWLHDEQVTLSPAPGDLGGWVQLPTHFTANNALNVLIRFRLGAGRSTAYADVIGAFPTIWTADHRGDGLATVMMVAQSAASEDLQKIYPQGMPLPTAVIEGNDELYDPRTGVKGYSTNIALFRLWHLTQPVGGKMVLGDMHLPDWAQAADVADEEVLNRAGTVVQRYQGGFWFRADTDPVSVGRTLDQAAELVLYETAEGKIGVHPGHFVEPDIRLTADDIIRCRYDPNKRESTTVLAVRGRFTDPAKGFNTVDAAIYGAPYPSDDERTRTVENTCVQDHNHMARLQKIAYIRANAPRVSLLVHYERARNLPYRRFARVHLPPKMTEAIVEITGRPTLSLRNLTYEFEGIVLSGDPYPFVAATEEGLPGANVVAIEKQDVPVPDVISLTLKTEVVSGGSSAAYIDALFTLQNVAFQYELEWTPTLGGSSQTVLTLAGALTSRTTYLADGVQYKLRSRTWSVGVPSEWTGYTNITATADATAPGIVTGVSAAGGGGQATFNWTAPNSANYFGARLYWNTTNTTVGATLAATEYGPPNLADSRVITGISAGARYGFIVAVNASGVAASAVGTGVIPVT